MLQQTRVEAVRGYFERWMQSLPDVHALAAVDEAVYMKLWEGLGYYSRVRNLHRAAVEVCESFLLTTAICSRCPASVTIPQARSHPSLLAFRSPR